MFEELQSKIDKGITKSRNAMFQQLEDNEPQYKIKSMKKELFFCVVVAFACICSLVWIQNIYKHEELNNPLISKIISLHESCNRGCSRYAVVETEGVKGTLNITRLDYETLKIGSSYNFTPKTSIFSVGIGTAYYHDPKGRFDNFLSPLYYYLIVFSALIIFFSFKLGVSIVQKKKQKEERDLSDEMTFF